MSAGRDCNDDPVAKEDEILEVERKHYKRTGCDVSQSDANQLAHSTLTNNIQGLGEIQSQEIVQSASHWM